MSALLAVNCPLITVSGSLTLFPPSDFCQNSRCGRHKPLKKAAALQVVTYTLANGVVPAWEVHLYCPDCNTTYYPNYAVQHNTRTYYGDIPKFISIGAHQYAERRLIGSWISLMLIAWWAHILHVMFNTNCCSF